MRKKSIQAKELKRVARERVAARLVYGDKEKPPPSIDKAQSVAPDTVRPGAARRGAMLILV